MNDNSPIFQPETLPPLSMMENASTGTELIILTVSYHGLIWLEIGYKL
jgi:hypothetical protein